MADDKKKDFWDKLDVISKLVSGVFLAAIAIAIKFGSDKISHTNEQSQLVRQLIADLTDSGAHVRQDVSLLTLDTYTGNDNPEMVAAIAERIFLEYKADTALKSSFEPTTVVAYKILLKRDSARAIELLSDLQKNSTAQTGGVDSVTTNENQTFAREKHSDLWNIVAKVMKKVVYIQYADPDKKSAAKDIQVLCLKKKWGAPGIELVTKKYPNIVRYFHAEDAEFAQKVAAVATDYFNGAKIFSLQDMSGKYANTQNGQLELWIGE